MTAGTVALGELMATKKQSLDPRKTPERKFALYSIPAYDEGQPAEALGGDIGSSKQVLQAGDVLLSRIVPHIRRAWIVAADGTFPRVGSSEWIIFRGAGFHPPYLRHVLLSDPFHRQFMNTVAGVGGSLLRARPKYVANIEIPLPPIEEQRRIAAVLDSADELRAKRREALAKLDTLSKAIFVDMFGDPVANPRELPTARLDEVFDIARGGSPRPIQDFLTDDPGGINWVMIGDAPEGTKYITGTSKRIRPEGEKRSRRVHPGDLLLTNSMSFGRPYIMRTTGCVHDGWLVLSPRSNGTSSDYFHAALGIRSVYDEFVRRAPGATVKNLNIDLVRSLELPVPAPQEQARFATAVGHVEACMPRAEESRVLLDDLFASLQQRAFRGEL